MEKKATCRGTGIFYTFLGKSAKRPDERESSKNLEGMLFLCCA